MRQRCPRATSTKTRIETFNSMSFLNAIPRSEGDFHENKD